MKTIELPKVSKMQLDAIIESLGMAYAKKLRKAQQVAYRPHKINNELQTYQTVLQEMVATARIYEREETNVSDGLATSD